MRFVGQISPDEWPTRWSQVRLDEIDALCDIGRMEIRLMDLLNVMCTWAASRRGWSHRINSAYREGDPKYHGKGQAVDIVFYAHEPGDVDVMEQFIFALQFDWGGVGFYPYWNAPGIHVDVRRDGNNYREVWWRDKSGTYHPGFTFAHEHRIDWNT